MKIGTVKCPKCESVNTWQYQREDCKIWDNSFHETMNSQFPDMPRSNDTIQYRCKCGDCENHFSIKLTLKCEVEDMEIL